MNWDKKRIHDLFLVTDFVANGSFASIKENVQYDYQPNYAVLIRTTDNTKNWNGKYVYVNKAAYQFLSKSSVKAGDIIISNVGDPGKTFICPDLGMPMTLGPNSILVRPLDSGQIDNLFFYYYTISKDGQADIQDICSATAQKKFNKTSYRNLQIPLPPLAEQKRIAAILDVADALRQKDRALLAKYDELAQSIFLDMFGDPVTNPMGWEKRELNSLTTKIGSGATPRGGKEAYQTAGISLIRSLNIYDNRFQYKNLAFINDLQANRLKNVTVEKDDVLFNITGASVCRSTVVPIDVLPARVNQHVSIIRPDKSIMNSLFLSRLLISENVKKDLLGLGVGGGAVMEAITKQQLQEFKIVVPPLEIQNLYAIRVQSITAQKEFTNVTLQKSENLFNSLLQRAFSGQLTNTIATLN